MTADLTRFWQHFETNFPPGGPRRHLRERLGADLIDALERDGVLEYRGEADRYPCPRPGTGYGCPREVIELSDGAIEAVCGNQPAECDDVVLQRDDIATLAVSPEALAAAVAKALRVRADISSLAGLHAAYRAGVFIPEPGIRHPVYLVVRASERDYAEALDALVTHAGTRHFAVLVPTERFISEEVRRRAAEAGAPIIALSDAVGIGSDGQLTALVDPVRTLGDIGRPSANAVGAPPVVAARALVRERGRAPAWRKLDAPSYDRLAAAGADYLIFADELKRAVTKGVGRRRETIEKVRLSYFRAVRICIERGTGFDPIDDVDAGVQKQTFQKARQTIDLRAGGSWALIKTDMVDNHSVYRFAPDDDVTFALIFAPDP